jgi:hypothetical protein
VAFERVRALVPFAFTLLSTSSAAPSALIPSRAVTPPSWVASMSLASLSHQSAAPFDTSGISSVIPSIVDDGVWRNTNVVALPSVLIVVSPDPSPITCTSSTSV